MIYTFESYADNIGANSDLQHASRCFDDLLESIIVDVASECHRIARLCLDRNLEEEEEELRLSAQARVVDPGSSCESNSKNLVDIFGQTHPAIATDTFDCMNCGRPITAGRFAPHLEKCMGKVRCYFRFPPPPMEKKRPLAMQILASGMQTINLILISRFG